MDHEIASRCGCIGFLVLVPVVSATICGCRNDAGDSERTQLMAGKTIQQVQQEHTDAWMAIPGVVGTAIGQCEGKPCILILTSSNTKQVRRRIPPTVEGYPLVVQYVGEVRALDR